MQVCRCPHCGGTFQVSIPSDSQLWKNPPLDEDGTPYWVCLDCHRQGLSEVSVDDLRRAGHDTSYRHEVAHHQDRAFVRD